MTYDFDEPLSVTQAIIAITVLLIGIGIIISSSIINIDTPSVTLFYLIICLVAVFLIGLCIIFYLIYLTIKEKRQ